MKKSRRVKDDIESGLKLVVRVFRTLLSQSRNAKVGWNYRGAQLQEIFTWDELYLACFVNVKNNIKVYLQCLDGKRFPEDTFFANFNYYKFEIDDKKDCLIRVKI